MARFAKFIVAAALSVVPLLPVALSAPAQVLASGNPVGVYVGYADNLRANPANFPTPWDGTSGVTFRGCQGGCTFDAGAVRVINTSATNVTIDYVKVHIDTCTYDLWPGSTTLAFGGQLIVTQTASGASDGCSSDGLMDTSDVGPGGSGYAGNCSPDGIYPTVDVSVGGTVYSYTDSAQVLNTGGIDLAECPSGTNESTQWQTVGGSNCQPDALLSLAPPSQNKYVGDSATVTATLTNNCAPPQPLQGAQIHFNILSGPNMGATYSGLSDSNGQVSYTYSSSSLGSDTIQASVTNLAGTFSSNSVQVNWLDNAPKLSSALNQTSTEGSSTSFTLGSFTDPDAGDSWTATVDWGDGSTQTTLSPSSPGALGSQSHTYADNGVYTVTETVTDNHSASDSNTFTVTVSNVAPTVTITSPATNDTIYPAGAVSVNASFADPGTLDTHTCTIQWDSGAPTSALVNASGTGNGACPTFTTNLTSGVYEVTVTVTDKDGGVGSATTEIIVYDPNAGFVTGGGWIYSNPGAYYPNLALAGKATFGFVSRYQKGSAVPTGETEFQFQTAGLNFHSSAYTVLTISGPMAQYRGSGTLNGVSGYTFILTARDGDATGGGGVDGFRMKIMDSTGAIVYDNLQSASNDNTSTNVQALGGGSIVIHR